MAGGALHARRGNAPFRSPGSACWRRRRSCGRRGPWEVGRGGQAQQQEQQQQQRAGVVSSVKVGRGSCRRRGASEVSQQWKRQQVSFECPRTGEPAPALPWAPSPLWRSTPVRYRPSPRPGSRARLKTSSTFWSAARHASAAETSRHPPIHPDSSTPLHTQPWRAQSAQPCPHTPVPNR